MVMDLCRAMAEAHARGIIHRDLKPANVLLTPDGKPKITDFGLAKQMEGDSQQTRSGAIMGTPSYMAPEQAWGQTREIGPLSDQYSLGAILYEMLVGRPPFQGASVLETLELVRNQEPVPPTRLQPKVPTDLETICLKALQKDPAKRFPDATAMAEDLQRFLDGEPIVARPVGTPERLWRWCKRNPRVAGLAAAVVLMGFAITVGSVAFAASLKTLNRELAKSYKEEAAAREIAQTNEQTAITAKNEAIAATKAEALARENEQQAREKAEALVQGAFAQNRNALEAQRVLSVLLNQRLLSIPGHARPARRVDQHDAHRTRGHNGLPREARDGGPRPGRIRSRHSDARRDQPARRPDCDGIRQVWRNSPLLPPHGGAGRATGRRRSRCARTPEGHGQRQSDPRRLPDGPDRRRRGRPQVL